MSARMLRSGTRAIGELQKAQQQDEFRRALRGLLMRPLMPPGHADFPAVRRQAERLREWFARETGWPLHVDREGARLFKRPADLSDPTRGLPDYDRRRYVLLCLEYHGDYDWPGIGIGNFVVRSWKAQPWRYSATEYLAAVKKTPPRPSDLEGVGIDAVWDAALGPAMQEHGMAIAEEAVVASLLDNLRQDGGA